MSISPTVKRNEERWIVNSHHEEDREGGSLIPEDRVSFQLVLLLLRSKLSCFSFVVVARGKTEREFCT